MPGPSGLPATGPDDEKGLIAGGGPAAKGLPAGRPGTFGRPGFPDAIIIQSFCPPLLSPFTQIIVPRDQPLKLLQWRSR